ncbi:MAG: hypothetical protein H0X63_02155 [Flavobacteriales bacterium]|nr:hypothetical protein [Flavobacteriales bacterium]
MSLSSNLIKDPNKKISNITYKHLNLPVKIVFDGNQNKYIQYIYSASGEKLRKTVKHDDSISNTRYIHGFQYYDNVLKFFHISTPLHAGTPEGYVKNTPTEVGDPSFDYIYQYSDHLGNVRVNYTPAAQSLMTLCFHDCY